MPWKETHKMELRTEFAVRALQGTNFSELCREYGISRKTGYKWRARFLSHGLEGMSERSRRPRSCPSRISGEVVCGLLKIKHAHMAWGPEKILAVWERRHACSKPPSLSSVKRIFEAAGLTRKRRKPRPPAGRVTDGRKAEEPNDVWTVDFKGWWRDREGLKVEPLTVRDERSRKILDIRILPNNRTEAVQGAFERLFEAYGLPGAMRSDNGPPFACSRALMGLSRLSAWWLALGIDLERGRPGHPQDNGAHERMHRDMRRELQNEGAGREQALYDAWREEYNALRPHKALDNRLPDELYRPSDRPYRGTPEPLDYGLKEVRKVTTAGTIKYDGTTYQLSTTLRGWTVGITPARDPKLLEVWYAELLLGYIEETTESFIAANQIDEHQDKNV